MSLTHANGGRGAPKDLEPLGVIDIGSNSVRLVVYEGAVRAATPLFNEKVLCGLGRGVASSGRLGDVAVERALEALRRFRAVARVLKVKNLRVLATAAVRDAGDGADFIKAAEKACGARVEVLTGEKEAELAAHGIRMGFLDPDGIAGDLGGGSLEVIDIYKSKLNEAATLGLGGLRLIDQTGDKLDKALPLVDAAIAGVPWLSKGRGRPFFAVGGTWRALAKMHMEHVKYPLRVMHGYAIGTREAIEFCQLVRRTKKLSTLPGIEDVARARREVLPYGALVLERLLEALAPSEVIFSVFGIREGLLFSLMPPHERAKDPLLCFCEDYAAFGPARSPTPVSFANGRTRCSPATAPAKRPRSSGCAMPPASSPISAGARTRTIAASRASRRWRTPRSPASITRAGSSSPSRSTIATPATTKATTSCRCACARASARKR